MSPEFVQVFTDVVLVATVCLWVVVFVGEDCSPAQRRHWKRARHRIAAPQFSLRVPARSLREGWLAYLRTVSGVRGLGGNRHVVYSEYDLRDDTQKIWVEIESQEWTGDPWPKVRPFFFRRMGPSVWDLAINSGGFALDAGRYGFDLWWY